MKRSKRKLGTRKRPKKVVLKTKKTVMELIKDFDKDCGNCNKFFKPLIAKECWTCIDKSNYERVS